MSSQTQPAVAEFKVSEGYRWYVVWLLFAVYVLNFVDRQILQLLFEPIKKEFKFTDLQLGLLGGLAFAAFYSVLGIPIARLADRRNRVGIISISLFIWSLFTVVTGTVRNFWQLFAARVAVGVGEAGCTPPAYSLISDYFEKQRRTSAISIYTMGIYGGVFVGYMAGAHIAHDYGWRVAFYAVGAPGLVLSFIVWLTLREPPRGFAEGGSVPPQPPPFSVVFKSVASKATFWHLALAAALHAFVGYGVNGFHSSFLMRSHQMNVADAGMTLAYISAISGVGGTWLGGWLADKFSNKTGDVRWQLWTPGIATLLNVPVAFLAYTHPEVDVVKVLLFVSLIFGVAYLGPTYSTMQRLVSARERAVGSAMLLLVVNLVGLGLGPTLVGWVSDLINRHFLSEGMDQIVASAHGLRWALAIMVCVNVWSFVHYMIAARTLVKDSVN